VLYGPAAAGRAAAKFVLWRQPQLVSQAQGCNTSAAPLVGTGTGRLIG
jgi:hypothetical protein